MTAVKKPTPEAGDIAVARRVLMAEAAGLHALAATLDDSFVRALDAMQRATGRVIVTGMGKSGHVARKIAATLASTGTPAQYVNPGEASHGDLGMITGNDAVLALSNSGETTELSDLVAHTRLLNIPLIAIVGRRGSALDMAADVSLVLPELAEACSLNLAPTTSTTAMLALGDALSVALLERQGFSPEDFSALHPGGQLGRRFIKLSHIMHTGDAMPMVGPDTPMSEVLLTMSEKSFGCVGIADGDGRLVGIITDGDLRRHMDGSLLDRRASEVMTPNPLTMLPDTLAAAALHTMNERKVTAVFVVQDGRTRGIVKIHDLLRAGIV
ncbi:MAG: KpsF/GutQ family sugar-phosphate isomerase [Alphaproteobacteria bacterium]|nr:KpsF/GutQ family sugar-phosphate isomerase [Alphaproteobacteria bacterium]